MKEKATTKKGAPKAKRAAKHGEEAAALEWFNRLSGRLQVELTEEPRPASERRLNLVAPPGARVVGVALTLEVFEDGDSRPLTAGEWDRVVLCAPSLRLRSDSGEVVEHPAPDCEAFTARSLAAAIEQTERKGRPLGPCSCCPPRRRRRWRRSGWSPRSAELIGQDQPGRVLCGGGVDRGEEILEGVRAAPRGRGAGNS